MYTKLTHLQGIDKEGSISLLLLFLINMAGGGMGLGGGASVVEEAWDTKGDVGVWSTIRVLLLLWPALEQEPCQPGPPIRLAMNNFTEGIYR
jgi:hypothetical protein